MLVLSDARPKVLGRMSPLPLLSLHLCVPYTNNNNNHTLRSLTISDANVGTTMIIAIPITNIIDIVAACLRRSNNSGSGHGQTYETTLADRSDILSLVRVRMLVVTGIAWTAV